MTTINQVQLSMTRGEVTPLVHGRREIEDYQLSLKTCRNWIVQKYGGVTRFPGTTYIFDPLGGTGTSDSKGRLLPFVFSEDEAYVLIFTHNTLHVYDAVAGEIVQSGGGDLVITTPYTNDHLEYLQVISLGDVTYIACLGLEPRTLIRRSATDWDLETFDAKAGPWLPQAAPGGAALKISGEANALPAMTSNTAPSGTVSGYGPDATTLFRVFDQFKHVAYSASTVEDMEVTYDMGSGEGFALTGYSMTAITNRTVAYKTPVSWRVYGREDGSSDWELIDEHQLVSDWGAGEVRVFEVANTKVYRYYRFLFIPGEASTTGGSDTEVYLPTVNCLAHVDDQAALTLTATSVIGINGDTGFNSDDVGRMVRIMGDDGFWRVCEIVSVTNTTTAGFKVVSPAPFPRAYEDEDLATTIWQLQSWGDNTGHPRALTTHSSRLAFFGTPTQPRSGWLSRSQDFDYFGTTQPLLDDDAVTFTLINGRMDEILWATSNGDDLLMGTVGGIRILTRQNPNDPFGPANIKEAGATNTRASRVEPVWIGNILVFTDKYRTRLYETAFSNEEGGYATQELTMLAEHLFRAGVKEVSWQTAPGNLLYCPLNDGGLVAATYDRQQRVFGASQIVLPTHGSVTGVEVLSAITVPTGGADTTFLLVRRATSGGYHLSLEAINAMPEVRNGGQPGSDSKACLASSVIGGSADNESGTASVTIPAFLVGSTLDVYDLKTDTLLGAIVAATTTVSLTGFSSPDHVQLGVRMTSFMETLRPPNVPKDGGLMGRHLVPIEVWADLLDARGLRAGGDLHMEDLLPEGDIHTNPDTPVAYTGQLRVPVDERSDVEGSIAVEAFGPYQATVRGLMVVYDRGS